MQWNVGAKGGLNGGGLPGVPVVVHADDRARAAFDDKQIGRLPADKICAILEIQFLVAPDQIRQPVARGQFVRIVRMVRPPPARAADVEQVFKEYVWRTIHGHRDGVSSLDARIKRIHMPAEFVGRVPTDVVAGRAQHRTKRVVAVHKRRGARAPILLRGGKGTEIE